MVENNTGKKKKAGMVERIQDLGVVRPVHKLYNEFSSHLDIGLF